MGALYPLRVAETTTTTGTGTLTLAGVPNAAYRSFAAQLGAGTSRVRYVIEWDGGFELGIGAFNGTDQITRSKVIRSSNGDAIVSLPAGAKTVFAWSTTAEPELGFTSALSADDVMTLDGGQGLFTGSSPTAQPLPAVATLPAGFMVSFRNAGSEPLTLDPDASETINGAATLVLAVGQRATLIRRAAGWEAIGPVATAAALAALSGAVVLRDGSAAWTADMNGGGFKLENIAAGVADDDAATVGQLADAIDAVPFADEYESAEQTITLNGTLTLAHSLAAKPKLVVGELVCKTAEFGYAINDVVPIPLSYVHYSSGGGITARVDATNIRIRFSSVLVGVHNITGGSTNALTPANWRLIVRAFA